MDAMQEPKQPPKKYCMITLMFPIADDAEALAVKAAIDNVIKDKTDKRYRFEITDN